MCRFCEARDGGAVADEPIVDHYGPTCSLSVDLVDGSVLRAFVDGDLASEAAYADVAYCPMCGRGLREASWDDGRQ